MGGYQWTSQNACLDTKMLYYNSHQCSSQCANEIRRLSRVERRCHQKKGEHHMERSGIALGGSNRNRMKVTEMQGLQSVSLGSTVQADKPRQDR